MKKENVTITAEEFDRRFDDGEDISAYLDWDNVRRPGLEPRRVNVDLPRWMISELDKQASLIGVTRQSIIKVWLSERIKTEKSEASRAANLAPLGACRGTFAHIPTKPQSKNATMKKLFTTFATLMALIGSSFAGPLDGVWINTDAATGSIPKVEITGNQLVWWGKTHPRDSKCGN